MRTGLLRTLVLAVLLPSAAAAAAQPVRLQFGIETNQVNVSFADLRSVWHEAEDLGFDSAWLFDHFMSLRRDHDRSCLEAWTTLAALAATTTRIHVGTLVTGNTYRNPALLAKMATTVDRISNGRLILGVGAGWFAPEHVAYGFPFFTARERAERLGEGLEVVTRLWSGGHPSFAGRFYRLASAPFAPAPVQRPHPPIVVGGRGKKWIMPLVARYGDGWNAPLGVSPLGLRRRLDIIRAECRRIRRSPCDLDVSVAFLLNAVRAPGSVRAAPASRGRYPWQVLDGTPEEITAQIQRYVDAGATHIVLLLTPPFDHALVRTFATQVMPIWREQPLNIGRQRR